LYQKYYSEVESMEGHSVSCFEAFLTVATLLEEAATKQKFASTVKVALARKMSADHILELVLGSLFVEGSEDNSSNATAFLQVATILEEPRKRAKFKGIIVTALLRNKSAEQLIELLRVAMFIEGSSAQDEGESSVAAVSLSEVGPCTPSSSGAPAADVATPVADDEVSKKRGRVEGISSGKRRALYSVVW
jgi:hypothetical protein